MISWVGTSSSGGDFDAQRREQVRLLHLVELQTLLRGATEQLPLEPVQLLLQLRDPAERGLQLSGEVGELSGDAGDRRNQPCVLFLQNLDSNTRQGSASPSP